MEIISEYESHANKFLLDNNITFQAKFLYHGLYWPDDKEPRNVWELSLSRNEKTITFRFGQSTADSFLYPEKNGYKLVPYNSRLKDRNPIYCENHKRQTQKIKPNAYDLLACLTKNDPGTFADFCSDFGYDIDSRKAEKTYFAVQEEWVKVRGFFTKEEIEQLQEIS